MERLLPLAGWILSLGSMSILLMSARWKLTFDPWYVKEWGRIGWDPMMLPRIAIVQLTCVALYLTPPTAMLGVVLLTGYLGGAISQYARLGEPYPILVPLTTALLAWAGRQQRADTRRRGAIAGAASVAAEDSASSVKVYSNPRDRCIRSYDFSFSRQNSSTSSVSSSMCWLKLTVNGFV